MSLVKKLSLATFGVLILLLVGTLSVMTSSSKAMLISQLESHGQDAATHLGLYLAPYIATQDVAAIETTVNAIFDSGFYQRIDVKDSKNNILFAKTTPTRIDDQVPSWFVEWVHITPPAMERDVTHGWSKVGAVDVQSRAGYAYTKLWEGVKEALIWFAVLSAAGIAAIVMLLAFILKPLKAVEEQASALTEQKFIEQPTLPGTRELRSMVAAMNKMVRQVRLMFDEQNRHIEELRRTAYQDNLTGLPNQRATETQLSERLDFRKDFGQGLLVYLRIANLANLNQSMGMEQSSNFIKVVAKRLARLSEDHDQFVMGRITGADFALLIPRPDDDTLRRELDQLVADINANYQALSGNGVIEKNWPTHVGIAFTNDETSANQALSEARLALQKAESNDETYVIYGALDNSENKHNEWHERIANAINTGDIVLQCQPLRGPTEENGKLPVKQQELFVRILDTHGKTCSAGEFISVIKQLGLMVDLDKAVIKKALTHLGQQSHPKVLAINLGQETLFSQSFLSWFTDEVLGHPQAQYLHIEVNESTLLNDLDRTCEFRELLKANGMTFGVDNFGIHPAGFGYLYNLQPSYVKVDGSLIRHIDQQPEDRFFVSSLISIAHSLSVQAYAEHVERETQLIELVKLNIDGTQGWLHGQPKALEAA